MTFSYELIEGPAPDGHHYRVRDAQDNRVATCWDENNARLIVKALNRCDPAELLTSFAVEWTCGHVAGHCCAECYQLLAQRATRLQAQVDGLADDLANALERNPN